jgi:hypothetical protein
MKCKGNVPTFSQSTNALPCISHLLLAHHSQTMPPRIHRALFHPHIPERSNDTHAAPLLPNLLAHGKPCALRNRRDERDREGGERCAEKEVGACAGACGVQKEQAHESLDCGEEGGVCGETGEVSLQ